jgi:hypothetical protein
MTDQEFEEIFNRGEDGHWAYRLTLREQGKEAIANAIAFLSKFDYVQAAQPSLRA